MTIDVDAPSFEELIESIFEVQHGALRVATFAEAKDFDADKKTVSITSWVIETPEIGIIQNVPVCFPGLVWDIQDGTSGMLIAGDKRWISAWRAGTRQIPEDNGSHDYDYAMFIPGLRTKADSISFGLGAGDTICPQLSTGDLLLGDDSASEYLVLGTTFDSENDTLLTALSTWVTAVEASVKALEGGPPVSSLGPPLTALKAAIAIMKNAAILSTDVKTK